MTTKSFSRTLIATLSLLLGGLNCYAAKEGKAPAKDPFAMTTQAYLGGLVGLSVPDAAQTTARNAFGLAVGANLSDEWSVGGFYLNSGKGEAGTNSNANFEFDYAVYGVEGNYVFDGSAKGAHFGARLGTAKVTKSIANGASYASSPFVWGLQAGYDFFISTHLSVGGELSELFFQGGPQDSTTGLVVGPFQSLNAMVAVKFWL